MFGTDNFKKILLCIQGIYFLGTGLWPVIHIKSFILVTCPKTDLWLVKTLGMVFFCEGVCFILGGIIARAGLPVKILAFINAFVLMCVDCYNVMTGTICPIYLADAGIEAVFLLCWGYVFANRLLSP